MSRDSLPEERTEYPTAKRMSQLRKEGQVHNSQDIAVIASMSTAFLVLNLVSGYLFFDLKKIIGKSFGLIKHTEPLSIHDLYTGFLGILFMVGPKIAAIVLSVATVASLAVFLQTKWNVKEKKLKFNFPNPITGLKRIVSPNGLMNTAKAIMKLCVILPIGYFALKKLAPKMIMLIHTSVDQLLDFVGDSIMFLFWKILYVLIVFAIIDYFWGKHQWLRSNRMTKVEVKDERRAQEGDEQTKRRIQSKGLNRIAQRIRQSVPQADVIITNPTHYAIALKYDRESMAAPVVLAKGKGFLALKIREIAKEARIPIVERKPLARALYSSAEIGKAIPYELFRAVAEVIAYVYKLKNPWANFQKQNQNR